MLNQAIANRLLQIETKDSQPTEINQDEIKRIPASIYGLGAIASELYDLTEVIE